jgi:hypothetical protein
VGRALDPNSSPVVSLPVQKAVLLKGKIANQLFYKEKVVDYAFQKSLVAGWE